MSNVQCFCCKGLGHFASHCPKKVCSYCKEEVHVIKECPIRPSRRNATAFTASIDLSGKAFSYSSPWYFDSGASNHMTNNAAALKNVTNYCGDLKIHTADGNILLITAIGDTSSSLTDTISFTIQILYNFY